MLQKIPCHLEIHTPDPEIVIRENGDVVAREVSNEIREATQQELQLYMDELTNTLRFYRKEKKTIQILIQKMIVYKKQQ